MPLVLRTRPSTTTAKRFGFKLDGGVIKMRLGGAWQALTDVNVLEVTRFDVALNEQTAQQACFIECAGRRHRLLAHAGRCAASPCDIEGRAVADPAVVAQRARERAPAQRHHGRRLPALNPAHASAESPTHRPPRNAAPPRWWW